MGRRPASVPDSVLSYTLPSKAAFVKIVVLIHGRKVLDETCAEEGDAEGTVREFWGKRKEGEIGIEREYTCGGGKGRE